MQNREWRDSAKVQKSAIGLLTTRPGGRRRNGGQQSAEGASEGETLALQTVRCATRRRIAHRGCYRGPFGFSHGIYFRRLRNRLERAVRSFHPPSGSSAPAPPSNRGLALQTFCAETLLQSTGQRLACLASQLSNAVSSPARVLGRMVPLHGCDQGTVHPQGMCSSRCCVASDWELEKSLGTGCMISFAGVA